ncbi:MAG: phosphate/phosphite/phosphonate ABC transporter substrate-binding protein [candidate division NC10 bacterium]|nr:phosphate/phosphite/phosphonate ABC transporter substrate-binding protein [candidate division NC10 bacterium]
MLLAIAAWTTAWAAQPVTKFGVDPRYSPRELFERYQPFLDFLQQSTGYRFELHLTKTYEEGIRDLGSGVVQLGSYGAVSYIVAQARSGGLRPILRGLGREGNGLYRAAIVAREDRGIRELKDLRGRTFGFGSPFSTQGYLLPRAMLEQMGIGLNELRESAHLGSHTSVARDVLLGKYDAGAVSDIKAREYEELGLRIIALSEPVPSSPIVAGRGADPKLVEAVRRALMGVNAQGPYRGLVKLWDQELAYGMMEAKDADYEGLRELVKRFGLIERREAGQGPRR